MECFRRRLVPGKKANTAPNRISGAAEETRTPDPIITNDVLYQLSYSGLPGVLIAPLIAGV
jgi:hypothetical protein